MKIKNIAQFILPLIVILQGCEIFEMGRKDQYEIILVNRLKESITIKTFIKGTEIEVINIGLNESFSRITTDRYNNPSFLLDNQVDSITITSQNNLKTLYCDGDPLIVSLNKCPEIANSFINLDIANQKKVNKKKNDMLISYQYSFEIMPTIFE